MKGFPDGLPHSAGTPALNVCAGLGTSAPDTCRGSGSKSHAAVVVMHVPVTDTRTAFVSKSGNIFFEDLLSQTGSAPRRARRRMKMRNPDFRLWAVYEFSQLSSQIQ